MEGITRGTPLGASYTLVDFVGKGASGEVWSLKHAKKTEPLAAKILSPDFAQDPAVVEHFVRERSVLMALEHPHIVTVHDMVVEGNKLALIMDYFAGGSLRDLLTLQKTLPPATALSITATILRALAYTHGKNVVHRDIKPDNVLLGGNPSQPLAERLHITDFGIAAILDGAPTNSTGVVGTPFYLPPELIQHGSSAAAGDVYSTGILLYELLSGRTPFAGAGTDFSVAYRHITSEVPPLDLPQDIWEATLALLAKNPAKRPNPVDAAVRLEELAQNYAGLKALEPVADPHEFAPLAQAQTIIRGAAPQEPEPAPSPIPAPELGAPAAATLIKPLHVQHQPEPQEGENATEEPAHKSVRKKMILFSILGALLLVAAGGGIYWAIAGNQGSRKELSASTKQETVLPSGLSVQREAVFTPKSSTIELTTVYTAQKAPLSGDFLEVIPGADSSTCPNVSWSEVQAKRNQATVTGMNVTCGWAISGVQMRANSEVSVKSTVSLAIADQKALDDWLNKVSTQTLDAISSSQYSSSAYPVQRIQGIQVKTPSRTVSQTSVPVSLLPIWPSGVDELNPLYSTEVVGKQSSMLSAIAGQDGAVKFSDGCGGHLMVDSSGLKVTALSVADQCTVNASVGNFTDLRSNTFSVTTRK